MTRRVLVVEDDRDLAPLVATHLRELGCEVDTAADGLSGLEKAAARKYDVVILDLMLPGLEGLEVCRRLRARPDYPLVLMLTARTSEVDRVLGLEVGADDYMTKPFSLRELAARVKALLRREELLRARAAGGEAAPPIEKGDLVIDVEKRRVKLRGSPIGLTAKEFDLLVHLARRPGRVYTRAQLLEGVWSYGYEGYEHTVNSHINRLRSKIERDPARPRYVLTVWGVGYKFADPDDRRRS